MVGRDYYPPRCGGLLCVAPKGAEEKLAILPDIKIPMLMYVLPTFLLMVRNMSN
ncbi:MAG: hypothetical protein LBL62_01295 [Planctomycetaceae bacterium]|jgi:hypothetical protein|nr:hypothetical protein [Planctomycetaceae bacterium]